MLSVPNRIGGTVAVRCSVLQSVTVRCRAFQVSLLQCVAMCCVSGSCCALQRMCSTVCCSAL